MHFYERNELIVLWEIGKPYNQNIRGVLRRTQAAFMMLRFQFPFILHIIYVCPYYTPYIWQFIHKYSTYRNTTIARRQGTMVAVIVEGYIIIEIYSVT